MDARHAETEVAWASERSRSGHGSWYAPGKWGIVSEMGSTLSGLDARLPENTLVYGVDGTDAARAYPLSRIQVLSVVNDRVGRTSVVLVRVGTVGAAAFDRTVGDRILTFTSSSEPGAVMTDAETASLWSVEGEATRGPLRGQRLRTVDGYVVEWHVWSAYNPRTEIFGESTTGPRTEQLAFPRLTLPALEGDGGAVAVPLAGKVNLVALWAAWCAPCRAEMPEVQRLVREHSAAGLAAVGIAIQIPEESERVAAREFATRAALTFPNFLVDDAAYDRLDALSRRAGGPGLVLPTVFLTDAGGSVLAVLAGREVDRLPEAVREALGRRSALPTPPTSR